jgi:hypothetical protein
MADNKPKPSDDWSFPPDLAAILGPILATMAVLYVTCAISWARAFGDTSLTRAALRVKPMRFADRWECRPESRAAIVNEPDFLGFGRD